jgi:hypothetical protein
MVERRRSEYFEKWLKMTLDRTPWRGFYC